MLVLFRCGREAQDQLLGGQRVLAEHLEEEDGAPGLAQFVATLEGLHARPAVSQDDDRVSALAHVDRAIVAKQDAGVGVEAQEEEEHDAVLLAELVQFLSGGDDYIIPFGRGKGMDDSGVHVLRAFLLAGLGRPLEGGELTCGRPELRGRPLVVHDAGRWCYTLREVVAERLALSLIRGFFKTMDELDELLQQANATTD